MYSIPHAVGWTAIVVQCAERLEPVLKALKKKKKSRFSKGNSKHCEIWGQSSLGKKNLNALKTLSEKGSLLPRGHNIWLRKSFLFNSGIIFPAYTDTAQHRLALMFLNGIQFHKERATETEKKVDL